MSKFTYRIVSFLAIFYVQFCQYSPWSAYYLLRRRVATWIIRFNIYFYDAIESNSFPCSVMNWDDRSQRNYRGLEI